MSETKRQCTFTVTTWIHIRGEKVDNDPHRAREDGDLVGRFLEWSAKERIHRAEGGGYTGGGGHSGSYAAKDAKRIIAWLREQGAIEALPR